MVYKYGARQGAYYAVSKVQVSYGVGIENFALVISDGVTSPYQGESSISTKSYTAKNGTTLQTRIKAGYWGGYMIRLSVNNGSEINFDGEGSKYYLGYIVGDSAQFPYSF